MTPVQEMTQRLLNAAKAMRENDPFLTHDTAVFLAGFCESGSVLSCIKVGWWENIFSRFVFTQDAAHELALYSVKQQNMDDYEAVRQIAICFALMDEQKRWIVDLLDVRAAISHIEKVRALAKLPDSAEAQEVK